LALAPIEQSCYWMASRPPRAASRLAGEVAADVAIVGAGFTGLWTALFLKELEPSLSVCVLEKSAAGYGASGRNAGIVGETIDHSHELAIAHFGLDEARELARVGRENLDEMERFLRERAIDAGFERPGQLNVALTPAHVEGLEESRAAAERVGAAGWKVLSRAETQAEVASPLYLGALVAPRNALVDPVRLVDGLRAEAARQGVRIYEGVAAGGKHGEYERDAVHADKRGETQRNGHIDSSVTQVEPGETERAMGALKAGPERCHGRHPIDTAHEWASEPAEDSQVQAFKNGEESERSPASPDTHSAVHFEYKLNPGAEEEPEEDSGAPSIEEAQPAAGGPGEGDEERSERERSEPAGIESRQSQQQ